MAVQCGSRVTVQSVMVQSAGPYLRGGGFPGSNPPKIFDMNFFSTHLFGISRCVVLLHSPVSVIAFSMIFSQYLVIFMIICANY